LGQINFPALNKVGYFLLWDSVWEDFFNYKQLLTADIFLKNLIYLLFSDYIMFSNYFLSNKYFYFLINSNSVFFNKYKNFNDLIKFFKKQSLRTSPVYFGKVWFIQFQNWILISLYIYKPLIKKIIANKETQLVNSHYFFKIKNKSNFFNKFKFFNTYKNFF